MDEGANGFLWLDYNHHGLEIRLQERRSEETKYYFKNVVSGRYVEHGSNGGEVTGGGAARNKQTAFFMDSMTGAVGNHNDGPILTKLIFFEVLPRKERRQFSARKIANPIPLPDPPTFSFFTELNCPCQAKDRKDWEGGFGRRIGLSRVIFHPKA